MRPRLLSLATGIAALVPGLAAAHVEVHIGASAFGELVRRRIEANRPCPRPLDECLGKGSGTCYLDHVETRPGGFLRRVAEQVPVAVGDGPTLLMPRLQYVQPIAVYSKTLATIRDPSAEDDDYEAAIENLQLMLDVTTNKNKLCLGFAGFAIGLQPGSTQFAPLDFDIGSAPEDVCLPVRLKPVERIIGSGPPEGLLVAASADLETLALRLRFPLSGPPSYVEDVMNGWQSFLLGSLAPGTVGEYGWSVFISDGLIAGAVKGRYQSTLEHSSKIQLDGEVEATWDAALGPAGGVGVEFYGELPVSGCLNSIGLSPVNVSHSFSLDAAHEELVLGGSVSWSVNEADVLLCGLSAGHIDGLLVTSAVVGGGLYAGNYEPDPADIPVPGECSQASATTFTCRYAVDMPKLDGAPLLLSAATPSPEGLVISGTVFLGLGGGPPPGDPGPLAEAYDVTQAGGSGYFTGHCGHGPYIQDPYWAKIRTRGEYCDSEFVPESNPLHVYGLQPTWIHVGPISDYSLEFIIGVLFPAAGGMECAEFVPGSNPTVCAKTNYDVFWEDPYNMLATVWTRDGARTVGLRPPDPPADPTQPDWYEILQKAEEFNQCLLPYVPFELPSWEIDPPPDYALHLPGERGDSGKVSLQNLRIEPLTPLADRRGQAYESGVWLGLHAEAVVVVEGRRFTVPVEAPFQVDWEVQRDVRGGTSALVLGRTAGAKIDVGKALPAAYQNAWFDVGFSPGGIVVHGQAH